MAARSAGTGRGLRLFQTDADLVAAEEQDAPVLALVHVLFGLEERELVVARLGGIRAELRAVAALVAHLVDVDDLMAAIGQLDHDVRAFGQESTQFSQTVLQSRQRPPSQQAQVAIFRMPFLAIASALAG